MTRTSEIGFQLAVYTGETLTPDALVPGDGIDWLNCRNKGGDGLEFARNGKTVACVDFQHARFDLPDLLAIIVVGTEEECAVLKGRWVASFPIVGLEFKAIPRLTAGSLSRAAVEVLAAHLRQQRRLSGQAALDLAAYRGEFERLQLNFSRLEEFVGPHQWHQPVILFDYPPAPVATQDRKARPNDLPGLRLIQHLPVDSLGVYAVELNLRTMPPDGSSIRVSLSAIETDRTFGAWSIEAANASPGWVLLTLTRAIDESELSLAVTIELPAGLEQSVFALGQPHPYEEFRARCDGGEPCRAPLAMRILAGLPGVQVPGVAGAIRPTDAARTSIFIVPARCYEDVSQVSPPEAPDGARLVTYEQDSQRITVHPHGGGATTIGRMDLRVPKQAWCLSAQIGLEHEQASPTEFGLLVCPLIAQGSATNAAQAPDALTEGFSGWIRLAALEESRISAFLPKTDADTVSVYLLSRQEPDASPNYGWARFQGFEFNGAPKTREPNGRDPATTEATSGPVGAVRDAGSL
jgi:hypothetical protein